MKLNNSALNKNPQIKWNNFIPAGDEPVLRKNYDLTPEMEEMVLEHGLFLKQRARRNMRKIRRQNFRQSGHRHWHEPHSYSSGRMPRHHPAH